MSIDFKLFERIAGFAASAAKEGEKVGVLCAEALTSLDGFHLTWRLEELQRALFGRIPGLLPASAIDNLLVVIRPNLDATAFVNELKPTASVRLARSVRAGDPIFVADMLDMLSFDVGVDISTDCGLVLVRSHGWRRALFYDLCPLGLDAKPRAYDLSQVLAKQTITLLRGTFAEVFEQESTMHAAISQLEQLIADRCNDESKYQELFERHPWFLGGQHTKIERHSSLDNANIPDYTGVRSSDQFRDIFEVKPPFLACFRKDGGFTAPFNDAWAQAERYLDFARQQRQYLRDKKLNFENPRCFLIVGYGFSDEERQALRVKESFNPSVTVLTYEQLLTVAKEFVRVLESAFPAHAPS